MRDVSRFWFNYISARNALEVELGVNHDLVTEMGNHLIAEAYQAKRNKPSRGLMLTADDRALLPMVIVHDENKIIQYDVIDRLDFDLLAVLFFDRQGFVVSAFDVDALRLREIITYDNAHRNWRICSDCSLLERGFAKDSMKKYYSLYGGSLIHSGVPSSYVGGWIEPIERLKNKEFAMKCIQLLKDKSSTLEADTKELCDFEYCKQHFNHSYAVLKCVTGLSPKGIAAEARDDHGNRRYYESPFPILEDTYIITNDWYGLGLAKRDNRTPFLEWVQARTAQ